MVLATKCLDNIILLYLCLTILITCWIASFSSRAFSELLTSHGNRIISTFQYHYILDLRKISRCTSPTLFIAVLLSEFLPEKLRVSWRSKNTEWRSKIQKNLKILIKISLKFTPITRSVFRFPSEFE